MLPALRAVKLNPLRDLPGLKLWWDLSQNSGVENVNRSGTMKISRSYDLSGNNNFGWIEDFDPWEPIWSIDDTYGFRYMDGTGVSGDWRIPNFDPSSFTAGTGVFVWKRTADPGTLGQFWNFGSSGNSNYFPFSDGVIYDDFGSTVRKTVGNPTPSLANWHIYSARSAANLWKANLDGVELFSTATNTVGFKGTNLSLITKTEYQLAALMVFNVYLDAGQLNALGRYLGKKFRIQWTDASA